MQRIEAVYSPRLPDIDCEPGSLLSKPARQIVICAWAMQSPWASPSGRQRVAIEVSAKAADDRTMAATTAADSIRQYAKTSMTCLTLNVRLPWRPCAAVQAKRFNASRGESFREARSR